MKTKLLFSVMILAGAILVYSFSAQQATPGPHGGRLKQAENYNIEMKMVHPNLYTYLLDQKLQSISNKGVSCGAKLFFYDNTSVDVPLKPLGEDGFIMESGVTDFHSCRITFNLYGKTISTRFENESAIVQKKITNKKQ